MKAWVVFLVGAVAGLYVGFTVGGILSSRAAANSCDIRICQDYRFGKWLDGHCYEASTLREVKP